MQIPLSTDTLAFPHTTQLYCGRTISVGYLFSFI